MMLTLDVPAAPVPQGTSFQGRVLADLGGAALGALQLELRFAALAFSAIQVQPTAFAQSGDLFDVHVDPDGVCTIVAAPAAPLTGASELFTFSAQADGLRGDVYPITVSVLSASTPDLVPIDADPVEGSVLVASGALGIATTALIDAHAGVFYAQPVVAEGGAPPYQFSGTGTAISGLTLDGRGLVSGTPSAAADASWTVQVTDSATPAAVASRIIPLRVTAPPPAIVTAALPDCAPGHDYDVALAAEGGLAPLQWTATGLPAGLQLQAGRIRGRVDAAAALGEYGVRLEVQDAELRPQHDARTATLNVHPAAIVQRLDVAAPGAVRVARDVHVAEYDIEVHASATSTYRDEETEGTLDRAMEEVLTEIFELMLEDGMLPGLDDPLGPDDPFEPFPGDPGDEPEPPGPGGRPNPNRDRLHELLQLYRWLDDQIDPQIVKFGVRVSVEIDGRFAYSWSNVDLRRVGRKARRARPRRKLTAKEAAIRRDLHANRTLWIGHAVGAVRSALRKTARKRPPGSMARWRGPGRAFFDERLERLLAAIERRDWNFWIEPPGLALTLTPGRHRVRLTPTILWSLSGESITGAMEIASAQAAVRATFRARNPHHWPRLDGVLVVEGVCRRGEYIEEDVLFPNSALDIVCESNGTLQIMSATGDVATPYAAPRAFAPAPGLTAQQLESGAVDDFGRTWLIASDGESNVILRNQGLGGFVRLDPPALHDGSDETRQIQAIETSGWGAIAVLLKNAIAVFHALHRTEASPPQPIRATRLARAVRSGVVHDQAEGFVVERHGNQAVFVVVDRYSGQITRCPLKLSPPEIPAAFLAGAAGVTLTSNPVGVALDPHGDTDAVAVAFRQLRQLQWFQLQNLSTAPGAPEVHPQVVHLPAPPIGLTSGPGAGHTVLVEPARQLLYCDAGNRRLFLLFPEGGATAMHGFADTLVLGRRASNEVIIFKDRRP